MTGRSCERLKGAWSECLHEPRPEKHHVPGSSSGGIRKRKPRPREDQSVGKIIRRLQEFKSLDWELLGSDHLVALEGNLDILFSSAAYRAQGVNDFTTHG